MATESGKPGRSGYVIGALIALLGIVGSVLLIAYVVVSILNMDDALTRVVAPGTTEVELDDTGRYTVFYEFRSTVAGRDFRTVDSPPDLVIQVVSTETGDPIPVSSSFENITYHFWTRSGESVASFRIDEPGTYEITAEYADGRDSPEFVLAFGEGLGTSILLTVGAGIGSAIFFCTTILIALAVVIITLLRRNRAGQAGSTPVSAS